MIFLTCAVNWKCFADNTQNDTPSFRQKSYLDATTEQDRSLAFLPKVEIQCWVEDSKINRFIESVSQVARTGRMGDGKIFILPVPQVSE